MCFSGCYGSWFSCSEYRAASCGLRPGSLSEYCSIELINLWPNFPAGFRDELDRLSDCLIGSTNLRCTACVVLAVADLEFQSGCVGSAGWWLAVRIYDGMLPIKLVSPLLSRSFPSYLLENWPLVAVMGNPRASLTGCFGFCLVISSSCDYLPELCTNKYKSCLASRMMQCLTICQPCRL
jgi:hypothetical protein